MNNENPILHGFLTNLQKSGVLPSEVALDEKFYKDCRSKNLDPLAFLIEEGHVSSSEIYDLITERTGIAEADLSQVKVDDMESLLAKRIIEKHKIIPIRLQDKKLYIATFNPFTKDAKAEIEFIYSDNGYKVVYQICRYDELKKIIDPFLDGGVGEFEIDESDLEEVELSEDKPEEDVTRADAEEAPIVKFVNKMLFDAIKKGSSDLHFEPYEKRYRVRFRTDGILEEIASPPVSATQKIAARLKVMSQMDISEKKKPQDGRIKLKISKTKAIDFRVNTLPTLFGEKIVLRILDPSSAQMGIDALGYEPIQKERYLKALDQPQGMILVTGPTGSGKTVSLYTGLNILNQPHRNISTAEDPVEINLEGINQVNVNPKQGLTFAEALKSFLRQDPDIIMVGEIRDLGTAEIAIKAAQTGHMVMSTLHTNSAPETLTRLINMGVPPFNIATTVSLIIAQRLARRLCPECKKPHDVNKRALIEDLGFTEEQIEGVTFYEPSEEGCEKCSRGYKGRVGIYEVMPISKEVGKIIMNKGNALEIAAQAQAEGINNLRQSAMLKAVQGLTSLVEVERVTAE